MDLSSETPIAIKLLRERIKFEKTFEKTQLFANRGINWEILCENNSQGAIELVKERIEIEKTMPYFQVLFYNKKYKYGVSWAFLCSNTNPEAFKLLRQQIEDEKEIYKDKVQYQDTLDTELKKLDRLDVDDKEKIIKYAKDVIRKIARYERYKLRGLLTNKETNHDNDRIDWFQLCANSSPEAVQLIKERIKYEKELTRNGELYKSKIDLVGLALNQEPEAIELLMQRIQDLHRSNYEPVIYNLSKNPSIIVRYDKIMKAQDETQHVRYLKEVDEITRMFSNIPTSIRAKLKST